MPVYRDQQIPLSHLAERDVKALSIFCRKTLLWPFVWLGILNATISSYLRLRNLNDILAALDVMLLAQEGVMAGSNLYWISTTLLSLLYLSSAITYLIKRDWVRQFFVELGYPSYLMPILIAVKILAVCIVLSRVSVALSDFVYAGMFYHLVFSGIAHLGVRKPSGALPAAVGLVLLATSFLTQNTAREISSPYAPATAISINH